MKEELIMNVASGILIFCLALMILSFNKTYDPNYGFSDEEIAEYAFRYNHDLRDWDEIEIEIQGTKGEGFDKKIIYVVYLNGQPTWWTTSNASFYASKMKMSK